MFFHENLIFKIYSHNTSDSYGTDIYEYNGIDEFENCAVEVDFLTSDGRLHDIHVRICNFKYDYLKSENQIERFREIFSAEMVQEDTENTTECGRTIYYD
jgi:hypothetical protein